MTSPKVILFHLYKQNDSAFGRLVRTIQLIKKWASRSPKSELDRRDDSFLNKFKMTGPNIDSAFINGNSSNPDNVHNKKLYGRLHSKLWVINPSGNLLYYWLALVTLAVLYNISLIIARETFKQLQDKYLPLWLTLDYLCDLVYVGDMIIQFLTGRCEVTMIELTY